MFGEIERAVIGEALDDILTPLVSESRLQLHFIKRNNAQLVIDAASNELFFGENQDIVIKTLPRLYFLHLPP